MFRAFGLQTHIWNNGLKSVLLLAGFPVLLLLLTYGLFLLYAGLADIGAGPAGPFAWAADALAHAWPFAFLGAGVWFAIAFLFHQAMIDAAVGAHIVERKVEPRAYNLLENLCISRGMKTPTLRIIETEARNAFASGLQEGAYSVTVTRGLLDSLDEAELEAVLAHELTHIRNQDVRLLVIAVVFVGIFSFVGEMLYRGLTSVRWSGGGSSGGRRRDRSNGSSGGGGAMIAVVAALAIIAVSYALAMVIRFSLSRSREYLADAGAVELTKNPDAMISALRKIAGTAEIRGAPSEMREMFFENAHAAVGSLFATHPPIEKRIAALVEYAGGIDRSATAVPVTRPGPWG